MNNLLKITEAAKLALHTIVCIAEKKQELISIKEIVKIIPSSEAHLSKILQRLGKTGLVRSIRGPRGGFTLKMDPRDISLLDVYQAIDGPLDLTDCLFDRKICHRTKCIMDNILRDINTNFYNIMKETRISDIAVLNV